MDQERVASEKCYGRLQVKEDRNREKPINKNQPKISKFTSEPYTILAIPDL